jgi:hypothetical protein
MDIREIGRGMEEIHLVQDRKRWRAWKYGNKTSAPVKRWEFLGCLSSYWVIVNDAASWDELRQYGGYWKGRA